METTTLTPEVRAMTYGATRSYPNRVTAGDVIVTRESADGGHFTGAADVQRGQHGRHYHVVVRITQTDDPRFYRIDFADDDPLRVIYSAANAKVLVRRQKPTTSRP